MMATPRELRAYLAAHALLPVLAIAIVRSLTTVLAMLAQA